MENNDSNPKPQQTGSLKLMTVFIGVLALHVLVIGGFTVYHLMSGGTSDADLVTDKIHKSVKASPDSATVSDGQLSDAGAPVEKTTSAPASATDSAGSPVTIPAPPETATSTTQANTVTAENRPAPQVVTPPPSPAPVTPRTIAPDNGPTASVPSGPIQSGPEVNPYSTPSDLAGEPPTRLSSRSATYTVKAHETLAKIAHRNHVKLAMLRSANGLSSDKLHAGQKLIIPARTEVATTMHESSPSIAATTTHHTSGPDRTLLGDSPSITKSVSSTHHEKAMLASGGSTSRHVYTVTKGDTLTRLAHRFHTSSGAIMALNNLSDAHKLRLGQKLRIPAAEARSATSTPAPSTQPDRIEPRATPSAQLANFIN